MEKSLCDLALPFVWADPVPTTSEVAVGAEDAETGRSAEPAADALVWAQPSKFGGFSAVAAVHALGDPHEEPGVLLAAAQAPLPGQLQRPGAGLLRSSALTGFTLTLGV